MKSMVYTGQSGLLTHWRLVDVRHLAHPGEWKCDMCTNVFYVTAHGGRNINHNYRCAAYTSLDYNGADGDDTGVKHWHLKEIMNMAHFQCSSVNSRHFGLRVTIVRLAMYPLQSLHSLTLNDWSLLSLIPMPEYHIMHTIRSLSHQADFFSADDMKWVRTDPSLCPSAVPTRTVDPVADNAVNQLLQVTNESTPDLVTLQLIEVSLKRSERNLFTTRQTTWAVRRQVS